MGLFRQYVIGAALAYSLEQIVAWFGDNVAETLAAINGRIDMQLGGLRLGLPAQAQRCTHMPGAVDVRALG